MTNISLSVDEATKKDIEQTAKSKKLSRSDVMREAWTYYRRRESLDYFQKLFGPSALRLGLQTDDEFERFLG